MLYSGADIEKELWTVWEGGGLGTRQGALGMTGELSATARCPPEGGVKRAV